jgi:hypothetical protein
LREVLNQVEKNDSEKEDELEGPKGVSAFIRKLVKYCPKLCYKNIKALLQLFERADYHYRQAILKVLANLSIYLINETLNLREQIDQI